MPEKEHNDERLRRRNRDLTEANNDFRHVLYTGQNLQLVLMSLKPAQDIGSETHATHDQFFRIEQGKGEIVIDGVPHKVKSSAGIVVPAGALRNLINTGNKPMKVHTIYGPPYHVDQLEQKTKSLAQASSEHFDGKLPGKVATEVHGSERTSPGACVGWANAFVARTHCGRKT